jgi:Domain of unknown function (DUF4303)
MGTETGGDRARQHAGVMMLLAEAHRIRLKIEYTSRHVVQVVRVIQIGSCTGRRPVTDWMRNKELLLEDSEPVIRGLFAENKDKGEVLVAIGYVFEFGRGQLCFDLCANTSRNLKESLASFLAKWPDAAGDEVRWNSGDFDYPGSVQDRFGGWSDTWCDELKRLDHLAKDEEHFKSVHEGIADVCCEALAELAKRGVLGDWSSIDFNVAALLDDVEQVKERDMKIRSLINSIA